MGYTQVKVGDQILLCSDGLSDLISDAELNKVLMMAKSSTEACQKLVELAKARGGHDNITSIVIRLHKITDDDGDRQPMFLKLPQPAPPPTSPPPSSEPPAESEEPS